MLVVSPDIFGNKLIVAHRRNNPFILMGLTIIHVQVFPLLRNTHYLY